MSNKTKTSESILFRPAVEKDEENLRRIFNDAKDIKEQHGDDAWGARNFTVEEVRELMSKGGIYIGEIGGLAVATVTLNEEDERIWGEHGKDGQALYVHKLARLEGYKGVGAETMSFAESRAKELGKTCLRLDNPAVLDDYYASLGFEEVGFLDLDTYKPTLREKRIDQ